MDNEYITVKESGIHNRGLFAKKDIQKGTKIAQYIGEKITKEESDKRLQKEGCVYIMWLNDQVDLDGDVPENIARFSNHSCNPNCSMDIEHDEAWLIARKNIKEGEEITWDYEHNWDDFDNKEEAICNCGSENCRRYMVRREDLEKVNEYIKKKEEEKIIKEQSRTATSSA